jgi:hypothetical protein
MTTSENSTDAPSDSTQPETIAEIEAEIEATREALGATVDELSHRLDVKGRASDKVADVKIAAQEKAEDVKTVVQDKTAVLGSQISGAGSQVKHTAVDMGERVKPLAQRREIQAAVGGAVLLGVGAAVARRRGK